MLKRRQLCSKCLLLESGRLVEVKRAAEKRARTKLIYTIVDHKCISEHLQCRTLPPSGVYRTPCTAIPVISQVYSIF